MADQDGSKKQFSVMVIEFTRPEDANKAIEEGLVLDATIHQCEFYKRGCKMKQCFHIGPQYKAEHQCGYCAEYHNTRDCITKDDPSSKPKCAVCKEEHHA
jgi:hypothetical protein